MINNHSEASVWKGALAGLVAGLVASWAMNRFQDVWAALSADSDSKKKETSSEATNLSTEQSSNQTTQKDDGPEDDTTVKAASLISKGVFGHKLTPHEKKVAGPAVHYGVGAAGGIVYGVAAELLPEVTAGAGLPYGATFWLVVDEGLVPLLGLSKTLTAYPISTHIYALTSHLVFGATAEGIRRVLRS